MVFCNLKKITVENSYTWNNYVIITVV